METAWEKMGQIGLSEQRVARPVSSGGCLHRAAESREVCCLYLGHWLLLGEKARWRLWCHSQCHLNCSVKNIALSWNRT